MCKKIEKMVAEKEINMNGLIEITQRKAFQKVTDLCNENANKIEVIEARFEEVREKVQADREFVDTRLSRIDDSAVIKRWVTGIVANLTVEINSKLS